MSRRWLDELDHPGDGTFNWDSRFSTTGAGVNPLPTPRVIVSVFVADNDPPQRSSSDRWPIEIGSVLVYYLCQRTSSRPVSVRRREKKRRRGGSADICYVVDSDRVVRWTAAGAELKCQPLQRNSSGGWVNVLGMSKCSSRRRPASDVIPAKDTVVRGANAQPYHFHAD